MIIAEWPKKNYIKDDGAEIQRNHKAYTARTSSTNIKLQRLIEQ